MRASWRLINRVNSNGQRNVVEASSSWALHCDALVRPAEPLEAHADHEQEVDGAGDRDPGERGSPRVIADPLPGIAHDEVDRQRHPPENGPKGVSHALIDEREVVLAQTLVVVQGDPKLEEEYRHREQQTSDDRNARDSAADVGDLRAQHPRYSSPDQRQEHLRRDAPPVVAAGAVVVEGAEVIDWHAPQGCLAHRL